MARKSTEDSEVHYMENFTYQLLKENVVTKEWISFINRHPDVREGLERSVSSFTKDFWTRCTPERQLVFKSLAFQPPQNIKVIIVGHDPIPGEDATGLAFSSRPGKIDSSIRYKGRGWAFQVLHDVLKNSGYLNRRDIVDYEQHDDWAEVIDMPADYDCCHEVWAQRGVLLYNASLTLWPNHKEWEHFTKPLLLNVIRENKQERLFVLCWGTNAQNVGEWLYRELTELKHSVVRNKDAIHQNLAEENAKCIIAIGHHPTHPKENNYYRVQATNQFMAIKRFYPGLFTLDSEYTKFCLDQLHEAHFYSDQEPDYYPDQEPDYDYEIDQEPDYEYEIGQEPDYEYEIGQEPDYEYEIDQEPDYEYEIHQEPDYEYEIHQEPDYDYETDQEPDYEYETDQEPDYKPDYNSKPELSPDREPQMNLEPTKHGSQPKDDSVPGRANSSDTVSGVKTGDITPNPGPAKRRRSDILECFPHHKKGVKRMKVDDASLKCERGLDDVVDSEIVGK